LAAFIGTAAVLLLTLMAFAPVSDYREHQAAKTEFFRGIEQHRQAAREASEALLNDTKDADAHHQLATALIAMGWVDEALSHFRSAIELRPDFAQSRYEYGATLLLLGQIDEAHQQLLEAVAVQPDYTQARMALADSLRLQQPRQAIKQLETVIRLDPQHMPARLMLISLLAEEGEVSSALDSLDESVQLGLNRVLHGLAAEVVQAPLLTPADLLRAARIFRTMAEHYADAGRWEYAQATLLDAIDLAREAGDEQVATQMAKELQSTRYRPPVFSTH
jgi:Tfp pilus assembly protein PilF